MTPDKSPASSYRYVYAHGHPRAFSDGRVKEHLLIAEKALGRFLESSHPIHHVDGNKRNNVAGNLVVCEDSGYHNLLHMRTRALIESGNANNRWCYLCRTWDRPENVINVGSNTTAHRSCKRAYEKRRYRDNLEYFKAKNTRNRMRTASPGESMKCGGGK